MYRHCLLPVKMGEYKVLLLFVSVLKFGYLYGSCIDRYSDTTCINIENCQTLRGLITKNVKTTEELNDLRNRICGFDGLKSKICCPNIMSECKTPDSANGLCIDIRNCSYFVSVLTNNPSPEDMTFITRSRCYGTAAYSVCCMPAPPAEPIQLTSPKPIDIVKENCPAAALPPDQQSNCCGQSEGLNKISGGAAAGIDQFTWLALLEYRKHSTNNIVINCGGALISGKYVLTAAHCVDFGNRPLYTLISIRLGEYNTDNPGPDCVKVDGGGVDCTYGAVSIPIERSIKHPDFRGGPDVWNDIALLRLVRMATFNYFVRPVCLPTTSVSTTSSANLRMLVAGWGAINETHNSSPVKLVVDLPYVDINTCHNTFARFTHQPRLWDKQICAGGEPGKDSCVGDSGGPLVALNKDHYEIVGIVSYGSTPCGQFPGIYTNVYSYLDWIKSNMHA